MITFACPSCKKSLSVKDEFAGKNGKCPHCKQSAKVPGPARGDGKPAATRARAPGGDIQETMPPRGDNAAGVDTQTGESQGDIPFEFDFLAPAQAPDEIGRLGPYRVLKVLGAGGMGVVFQAEDPVLERKVALKAMLPGQAVGESARKRFIREAKTAASIEHDNIVRIYQVGEDRGVPYIAMEFLKGEALDERLKKDEQMTLKQVVRIGKEAALGLAAAHKHGLVHRDIKPANLWLEEGTDRVKILDFGLARAASGDNANLTQSGAIIGTPAFMAPEQANGKAVDGRTDLFSLGCVLYRLCTSQLPFQGTDTLSTLMEVATCNPNPPAEIDPAVPKPLSRLIMKLLAKKPEERARSTAEVAEVLAELETNEDIVNEPKRAGRPKAKERLTPSGTLLEGGKDISKSLRDSIADEPAPKKKKSESVESATVVIARPVKRKKQSEEATNPLLLWGLIGGGVGLVLLVGVVVGIIVLVKSGKGSSASSQSLAQGSSSQQGGSATSSPGGLGSGTSNPVSPPSSSVGSSVSSSAVPPVSSSSPSSRVSVPPSASPPPPLSGPFASPTAHVRALLDMPPVLPPSWTFADLKPGAGLWSDNKTNYKVTRFSAELEGAVLLVRTTGDNKEWLPEETMTARRDCAAYAIIRRRILGKVEVPSASFAKLADKGWFETSETIETTFNAGEGWEWKVLRKIARKGEDIGGLQGITLGDAPVFFVFR